MYQNRSHNPTRRIKYFMLKYLLRPHWLYLTRKKTLKIIIKTFIKPKAASHTKHGLQLNMKNR